MKAFEFGEIIVLPFTYSDLHSSKRRPAVVLVDTGDEDVLVAKITSKQYDSPFDLSLQDWKTEGLLTKSFVRLHKLLVAKKEHVVKRISNLSGTDLERVRTGVRSLV
jgi:mRNA interferase MazF